jgi:hypothetical protein
MATPKPKPRLRAPKGRTVTARIEFKPSAAPDFCPGEGQTLIEMRFESVEALVECLRELEAQIENVTVSVKGRILDLKNISGIEASWDA